jgi:hypothetical protein
MPNRLPQNPLDLKRLSVGTNPLHNRLLGLGSILPGLRNPPIRPADSVVPLVDHPADEADAWRNQQLSADQRSWVERYRLVGQRPAGLWKWCSFAVELVTLPCVESNLRQAAADTKFLVGMVNCLLDDVSDFWRNHRFFSELLALGCERIPEAHQSEEVPYAQFTQSVWREIHERAEKYPCGAKYKPLLKFDLRKLLATIEHSDLASQLPEVMNPTEHDLYSPNGMTVTIASTIDLMASPSFRKPDLAPLRVVVRHCEWMARIGNLISTWEREIGEGDFSSGVFTEAVWRGLLAPEDLHPDNKDFLIETIIESGIEGEYLKRWQTHRTQALDAGARIGSFDVENYVERFDRLLWSEILSHRWK